MSQNKEMNSSITLTPKEYYNFRLLALQYQIQFVVEWTTKGAVVTCEAPFLLSFGYIDKIDF